MEASPVKEPGNDFLHGLYYLLLLLLLLFEIANKPIGVTYPFMNRSAAPVALAVFFAS
jgi:hypothetical protein